jgi:hypothetical protein
MDQFEKIPSVEETRHFEVVRINRPKVVINGDGLETHGLMACVSIAGSFDGSQNVAFMTHRGAGDVFQNLTDVMNIAEKHCLKDLPGTIFIFRQDESIMSGNNYKVGGERCDYQGLIEKIKDALPYTFKKVRVVEVRYGNKSTAETGDAILDLKDKIYKTDIEQGNF